MVTEGPGRIRYLVISNIREEILRLDHRLDVGMILDQDKVPRSPGFVSVGSRRYREWQNLALESTVDIRSEPTALTEDPAEPAVQRPTYPTPRLILRRAGTADVDRDRTSNPNPAKTSTQNPGSTRLRASNYAILQRMEQQRPPQDAEDDDEIYYHKSGDLSAEDLEGNLAVLPEIPISTTAKVSIEDLQVGDSGSATPEEIEKLRQIIWKKQHLLIGKGNALPPAGASCVTLMPGTRNRSRCDPGKYPRGFGKKIAGMIKGLLAAETIRPSTSPWASPIVIVRKSNGVDIRFIDYKLVNSLTRLMVYPMPLISDLLEDLDKPLWYCSLDMASGFWVVPMTDRAREISAFITPFGLFEWSRMPFGLKNDPQIYQRLVDNALYGFLKIPRSGDAGNTTDVFQTGIADDPDRESVLGRRSYIDEIMIAAESWDQMCQKVEDLLEACAKWNLSISEKKSFWSMDKVGYLGHRVSIEGLEVNLKDLKSLTDLPLPGSLRSMQ
ncbi:LOW QUALITY PROTEIN: reverse transcriptase [Phytophthora megakarya]|uniref:Reverse transcriptase n=1 Tax=Phytophthora megakarya TaxID=4795 RepID=A0A225V813_9STRA|nr:LOW QUALITY PROTEIN: reverse transcriptase [Phytophthora megakarya]